MNPDERSIWNYLKDFPGQAMSRREIARRAVKRRVYEENPRWVDAPLEALVTRGVVEATEEGHYRLRQRSI
jgi:hypothetical protein